MSYNPIIVVAGEPNSIFIEIFLKSLKKRKYRSQIILIASYDLLKLQMKKLNFNYKINLLDINNFKITELDKKKINLFDIKYKTSKAFVKISKKSKNYITNCFNLAFKLLKLKISNKLINGPISKKHFLEKKYLGVTEYLVEKTNTKNFAMLIYNKELSVCPITTHLPLKLVNKKINKKVIIEKTKLIESFYLKKNNKQPNIAVLGLNPHCESVLKHNEDEQILKPAINYLKKIGYKISGPYSADTIFLKNNRKKFDVIIGMYHDQVLTPLKTLYEYNAINITLGLPFTRVSPDHGPNASMIGKNISNPLSLIKAITFLDKN
jgi:4-hydroxythreonine-4-phosphate dehydrogenase